MMGAFRLSNDFLDHLIDCGIVPDNTVKCVITLAVGEVPLLEYEVLADETAMKAAIVDAPIEIIKDLI